MHIRPFTLSDSDSDAVVELWRDCGLVRPWNDPAKDIARKLSIQAEWFLVGALDNKIVATVMAGYDGHRGWINYLAVAPAFQSQGLGRAIMVEAEKCLKASGCPKINLQIRRDNLAAIQFYERIGFSKDDVISYGKRLISDH